MMQDNPERFSDIVKEFRLRADFTVEKVAEQADITERYLYRIENEDKKPSFDVLVRLVRTLSIPGDYIFYPKEKVAHNPDVEEIVHMLYQCDEHSLKIVKAVLRAILEDQ